MKHNHRRHPTQTRRTSPSVLERLQVDVAGIDCGAADHFVSVPPDRDPAPVQAFRTFTADLQRLADWLVACGITSVAMEATGVYWIPVYDILEARGLTVLLVNARHVKHVPGRKSDVQDCEWLRELHSVGLLRGSFRPPAAILALRALLRHRDTLVKHAGTYVQRMQKALIEMNLLLPRVVSDITGRTGLRILRALVAGERDPRCTATATEIAAALTGHYRDEHVFVLTQNLELFDMCQTQLAACDTAIEAQLATLTATTAPPPTPLPRPRVTRRHGNEPAFDLRTPLHHLTGADLTQIDGIAPYTALKLLSEIGTDMSRWPTEKHFTAWLTLAPRIRSRAAGASAPAPNPLPIAPPPCSGWPPSASFGARPHSAPSTAAWRSASGSPRPSPPPRARSPSSSTAPSKAPSPIRTPAPPPTTPANGTASCAASAHRPRRSGSHCSTARPARYLKGQFLRSGRGAIQVRVPSVRQRTIGTAHYMNRVDPQLHIALNAIGAEQESGENGHE